jgi:hypothetical protein
MSRPTEQFVTAAAYLALERQAETKRECLNSHVYTMSGASREHNAIQIFLKIPKAAFAFRYPGSGGSAPQSPIGQQTHRSQA